MFKQLAPLIRILALAGVLAFMPLPALGAPVQNVSYEQFIELLQLKVGEIKVLKGLWTYEREHQTVARIGGGLLRGILAWLELQLRTHSPDEVRDMPLPPLRELVRPGGDLDLFMAVADFSIANHFPRLEHWDALRKSFVEATALIGGPAMDRVSVSPLSVSDPKGALRGFYEGRLIYLSAKNEGYYYAAGININVLGLPREVGVMKELRVSHDLPSAEISPGAYALMKRDVQTPLPFPELPQPPSWQWWDIPPTEAQVESKSIAAMQRELQKLHASNDHNVEKTLRELDSVGLRSRLAELGLNLKSKTGQLFKLNQSGAKKECDLRLRASLSVSTAGIAVD